MRLVWLNDIHLNFVQSSAIRALLSELQQANADSILLAGDIAEADSVVNYLRQMSEAVSCLIYFVLGNHDFYRGSVKSVRAAAGELARESEQLVYLNDVDVVSLTAETALIGHDGWGDGRLGNAANSPILLNDFYLIEELQHGDHASLLRTLNELGDEAAAHFQRALSAAVKTHANIIALTHVPPFREATWHEGQISDDDWLPFFSCKAVGDVCREIMKANPQSNLTIYCGHTHGAGYCRILPNLTVHTGGAEYCEPKIQGVIEVVA